MSETQYVTNTHTHITNTHTTHCIRHNKQTLYITPTQHVNMSRTQYLANSHTTHCNTHAYRYTTQQAARLNFFNVYISRSKSLQHVTNSTCHELICLGLKTHCITHRYQYTTSSSRPYKSLHFNVWICHELMTHCITHRYPYTTQQSSPQNDSNSLCHGMNMPQTEKYTNLKCHELKTHSNTHRSRHTT